MIPVVFVHIAPLMQDILALHKTVFLSLLQKELQIPFGGFPNSFSLRTLPDRHEEQPGYVDSETRELPMRNHP